jgi:tetratricopeptide (TPR) repeat protein
LSKKIMVCRLRQCALLLGYVTIALASVGQAQMTQRVGPCGTLTNAYGPFDYTNPKLRAEKLPIVEKHHFTPYVYNLKGGLTSSTPAGDLDYTLRAFPNHHLALDAMARLHRRENAEKLKEASYSLSCYFERARHFSPNDSVVPTIEGIHFFAVGDLSTAERALLRALEINPQSPEAAYNLGLLYVRTGDLEQAQKYAVVAYDNGYPLPGLKNQLIEKGAWIDKPDDIATR